VTAGRFRLDFRADDRDHHRELDQDLVIVGRHPECDVVLSGAGVSRRHAKIVRDDQGWYVVDLESVNGTRVNGHAVAERRLMENDVISIGPNDLEFHVMTAPRPAAPSDAPAGPLMTQSINVDAFKRLLEQRVPRAPAARPSATPAAVEPGTDWALPVISRAARALLSYTNLDDLLETVIDLVFEHLPAERGGIFLCDRETGVRTLRVARSEKGESAGALAISSTIAELVIERRESVLFADVASDAALALQDSIVMNRIRSAMCAPLYSGEGREVEGLIYTDTQNARRPFESQHLEVLTTLAMLSSVAVEQAELREDVVREQRIRDRLARYCPAAVDSIAGAGLPDEMLAEEREVSVLFLDICGFTTLAESLDPGAVTRVLNDVFGRLSETVFAFEGTLDKFMGDGIMAIFGAPLAQPDHAERAVRAALRMQEQMLASPAAAGGGDTLRVRIGINSGPVIAGDIGSPRRKDYTVIGDAVNVASRLESEVARPGEIIIGPGTLARIGSRFVVEPLEPRALKGKSRSVTPHRVQGERPAR